MSYGDPTNPIAGGGPDRGFGHSGYDPFGEIGRDDPSKGLANAAAGRVSAGRASVGRASVGRAPVGRAPVGRPSAPPSQGRLDAGELTDRPVGATAGRARVRGSAQVGPRGALDTRPPDAPDSRGTGKKTPTGPKVRSKKARRRNWIIASIAAFIMVAGASLVGGTYVFASVATPDQIKLGESTTIYFGDGKTEMAKIGEENRTIVPLDKISINLQHAVVAAEDRTFYSNKGVDFKGIVRAAWNNFTGGQRQGASTITQQYAREAAKLKGDDSYTRKIKEAMIALKLNKEYSKNDIMYLYLNTIYFGRGAYGAQAAALAYFNTPADKLTVEQGIVLAGLIKNPEGKDGSPFDPSAHPDTAKARFDGIRDAMIALKFDEAKPNMTLPTVVKVDPKNNLTKQQFGLDRPTGMVVHHVMDELSKLAETNPDFKDIKNAGLKIYTTIDPKIQQAAERYGDPANKESPLYGQPANLQAALVAVEPYTGRVLAYYGGPKGDGSDYAGWYSDPVLDDGTATGFGAHPPGSSMKIYTLAAGLREGYSVDSYWDASSPKEFPKSGRVKGTAAGPVKNSSSAACNAGTTCRLWEAAAQSLNTPFYALGERVGAAKVLETARAAGIQHMWASVDGQSKRIDLNSAKVTDLAPKYFSTEVSIGQYPITVLDHANGVATLAARGSAAKVHFVSRVEKSGKAIYGEQVKLTRIPGYNEQMADDEAWALQKVKAAQSLASGRPAAGKTGTWQLGYNTKLGKTSDNAHAWMIGYTAPDRSRNFNGVATAVWLGNKKEEQALKFKDGSAIFGASGPGVIWKKFMDEALKGKPVSQFPDAKHVGDETQGNASSPAPAPPVVPVPPGNGQPSPTPSNGNGGGGGGGGGGPGPGPVPLPSRSHKPPPRR